MPENSVIIVSGPPRSGTSLLMQMLAAGGVPVVTDAQRRADASNLRGYFEDERAKRLAEDAAWVSMHPGEAIKVVSPLLPFLPGDCRYRVLFLHRDLDEVVASQRAMLRRDNAEDDASDARMKAHLRAHLQETWNWLCANPSSRELLVFHRELVQDPAAVAARVAGFLGLALDLEAMAAVVDPALWRERAASARGGAA